MKRFNLTGLCIPDKHYMVDLSEKVDKIVKDYIDQGAYFTINQARQFGKTTLLSCLQRKLSDRYLVIRLSFEGVDEGNFDSSWSFVNMFWKNTTKRLVRMKADQHLLDEWVRETGIEMDAQEISSKIHFYTGGYPFLISWICKWIDESGNRVWTVQGVEQAERDAVTAISNVVFETFLYNHMIVGKMREKYFFQADGNQLVEND